MKVFRFTYALFASMLLVAAGGSASGAAVPVAAFVNVAVVPMDQERVLENWAVVVVHDRIRELGPAAAVSIPDKATVIDGRGKYLMPGLADMHAHTWEQEDSQAELLNELEGLARRFRPQSP